MDASRLLQWWDEWQLSVLVLGSLGVKCFLAVAAGARKSHIGPVYRFLIWLSYLGGDALAIYALAALLNIQKKAAAHESSAAADRDSHALQLLWAPIMLMHLGGVANISAYNIEDNELWRRHIATSVTQVAVALYVFCKLWSSSADNRLLAAAILLFVPGVFKCFEKPLALRRSSFRNLVSQQPTNKKSKPSYCCFSSKSNEKKADGAEADSRQSQPSCCCLPSKKRISKNDDSAEAVTALEQYIENATACASWDPVVVHDLASHKDGTKYFRRLSRPDNLFVDLARPYTERLADLIAFWAMDEGPAQQAIGAGISNTFSLLYTKDFTLARKRRGEHTADLLCSLATWIFCLLVPVAAIVLLHTGRTEAYRGSDVKITFLLLYVTLFVDACSIFSLGCSDGRWHGKVAQRNLMALFARSRRRPWLAAAAERLGCAELLAHLFFPMDPCDSSPSLSQQGGNTSSSPSPPSPSPQGGNDATRAPSASSPSQQGGGGITSAVRSHVRDGWTVYIKGDDGKCDAAAAERYSRFSDMRGQWTINEREKCHKELGGSLALERPFDEAVLVWHLATDLCQSSLSNINPASPPAPSDEEDASATLAQQQAKVIRKDAKLATEISNYMMHLLFSNPEMLMPGSRPELCTLACQEMDRISKNRPQTPLENTAAAVADRLFAHPFSPQGEGVVYAAWLLARALERLGDKAKAWRVIRGVWVEMLCFSAIRCRGYLHAKGLGSGGEYLTFVWLLMAHAGLETFPERQQEPRAMQPPNDNEQPAAKQAQAPLQN